MALDEDLLRHAREAEVRLADAQHHVDLARADFHHAVRRMHIAGASMREIAEAMRMSHQRVHQIVEASGGSRRWRSRKRGPAEDLVCTFCDLPDDEVGKLIAGPGVYICDSCVALVREVGEERRVRHTTTALLDAASPSNRHACSFCGTRARKARWLVTASVGASICDQCVRLCDEIIAAELG